MTDWKDIAEDIAKSDAGWYAPEAFQRMLDAADIHAADELASHVAYYDRAAADISQALEHVEDVGSEAAVALRAVQRTMSGVATTLRRRAVELRGTPSAAVEVAE